MIVSKIKNPGMSEDNFRTIWTSSKDVIDVLASISFINAGLLLITFMKGLKYWSYFDYKHIEVRSSSLDSFMRVLAIMQDDRVHLLSLHTFYI